MKDKNPEILAPGGDFTKSIYAFQGGADAVYIGLKQFSARKGSTNFSLKELRQLKNYASLNNKKIYVALNTLINDDEIEDLLKIILELEEIQVDAIIVQDLGVASLIKNSTSLQLHASTQLAIHNRHGIIELQSLGFSRVVLSREVSFSELKKLKKEFPNMEFEIFIHGALCYGFSGLCLASSKLLNRSGNRGECGQICRSWFNNSDSKGFYFSLNDLNINEKVLELKEIGIDSLKIEGRLKSSNYAFTVSSLYYKILNGLDYSKELINSKIEFSRSGDSGYLGKNQGGASINKNYPSHLGMYLGEITDVTNNRITFKKSNNISLENRDGLLILPKDITSNPIKFSTSIIKEENNTITLKASIPQNIHREIFKISDHKKQLKSNNPDQYKIFKTLKNLDIKINSNSIELAIDGYNYIYDSIVEESLQKTDIKAQLDKIFCHGGETNYSFVIALNNQSNINYPFIPSSALKKIRTAFQESFINDISNSKDQKVKELLFSKKENIQVLSYIKNSEKIPFITNFKEININNLTFKNNKTLLPLSPIVFNSNEYLNSLIEFISENKQQDFIIGLNNLSHLHFIKHLPSELSYYCDYGIYCCNKFTMDFLKKHIPNLQWVTTWVEDKKNNIYPPIFISRTCFKSQEDGCPKNCKKDFSYTLDQNHNKYEIIVKDCITYTISK